MQTSPTAEKWDAKYAAADINSPAKPCFVLQQHSRLLPFKGKALELACGLGGNARFLAQCGLKTSAWDISDNALTVLNNWASINQLPIEPVIVDLDQMLFPYAQFDIIVVSRYLNRQQFSEIANALKPNGLLYYQTFLAPVQDNAPRNPDFYIHSGEFNRSWPNLKTEVYGEGWLQSENDADAPKQRYAWYVGRKQA